MLDVWISAKWKCLGEKVWGSKEDLLYTPHFINIVMPDVCGQTRSAEEGDCKLKTNGIKSILYCLYQSFVILLGEKLS